MQKIILLTGATDGIGLKTARMLVSEGHHVLLHGRNPGKLQELEKVLRALPVQGKIETFVADLSKFADVEAFATEVMQKHTRLDVLINNAGVFRAAETTTAEGLDIRFVVNTFAPYMLAQKLIPLLGATGRIVNVSSAAQSPVSLDALIGNQSLPDGAAYAQSKLALNMWSRHLADTILRDGPMIVAVNPGSLLGTKMVKEAFGVAGADIRIGAKILMQAALSDEFANASGRYFDNDSGRFAPPHPDALNPEKCQSVVQAIEQVLVQHTDWKV